MRRSLFIFGAIIFLEMSFSLALGLFEEDPVKVNFCCPDGEILKLGSFRNYHMADCVKRKGLKNSQDGTFVDMLKINVNNKTEFVKMKLGRLGIMKPNCSRGLKFASVNLNQATKVNSTEQKQKETIELRQFEVSVPDSNKGTVYVNGKPVCADGWNLAAARVACRMLGFAYGEPTEELHRWSSDGYNMRITSCSGEEASLFDCEVSEANYCGQSRQRAGVICSPAVFVAVSGKLVHEGAELGTDEYCLNWETSSSKEHDGSILALSCDQCMGNVMCFYAKTLFKSISGRQNTIRQDFHSIFQTNIVNVGDKNGDDEVSFDEFKTKFVEYITVLFNILDKNKDGSIDEGLGNDYSLELFEKVLEKVVEYFDYNNDDSISTEDFTSGVYRDIRIMEWKYYDGKVSIAEFFVDPIRLSAPLYTTYTNLDQDQDEILTMAELVGFLRVTFSIIDKNKDCYINLEELIAVLDDNNLPSNLQLAVKMIGQQYTTLAKYIVDEVLAKADSNVDGQITLDEIVKFSDFAVIELIINVAVRTGFSTAIEYLIGGRGPGFQPEMESYTPTIWLKTLNSLIGNPAYQSEPPTHCGSADG